MIFKKDEPNIEYEFNHIKAIVTISTVEGYHSGEEGIVGMEFDDFCKILQEFEESFVEGSISWLVRPGKAVYKQAWGAPKGGEPVFVLEADYTEYDKGTDRSAWRKNIFTHAEALRKIFKQETIRVTFIEGITTTVLR